MHLCKPQDKSTGELLISCFQSVCAFTVAAPLLHHCKRQYRFSTHVLSATDWSVHIGGK